MSDERDDTLPSQEEAAHHRDDALERVSRGKGADHRKEIEDAIKCVMQQKDTFICDDIWAAYGLDRMQEIAEPRILGAVLRDFAKQGLIINTGDFRKSTRRHATPVMVWKAAA